MFCIHLGLQGEAMERLTQVMHQVVDVFNTH
jgi:hypothetical protein